MIWDLPTSVEIKGTKYKIRNKCDYKVVLDVICVLDDNELDDFHKMLCALRIFFVDKIPEECYEEAIEKMFEIISNEDETEDNSPTLMNWEQDFKFIAPAISKVLGYSVREKEYTHWYDFIGAYMEIDSNCLWFNIISIREKLKKGKPLAKEEKDFYIKYHKWVDLPEKLTKEEEEFLSQFK